MKQVVNDKNPLLDPCTNSLGMKLIPIKAGLFVMGEKQTEHWFYQTLTYTFDHHGLKYNNERWFHYDYITDDGDERPDHSVQITEPFLMSETVVTNSQYEQFDPEHRKLRGCRDL